jgi:hypothetical protein
MLSLNCGKYWGCIYFNIAHFSDLETSIYALNSISSEIRSASQE